MSSPLNTPVLDHLATRPFSFYPPIVNIEHNEWLFRQATGSESLGGEWETGNERWIPQRYIGEVSKVDDPVLIVGLTKELEYKGGTLWPYQRRVIQMPMAVGGPPLTAAEEPHSPPPSIAGMRVEAGSEGRVFKLIGGVLI